MAALSALPSVADALAATAGIAPERARGVLTAALLVAALALRAPLARALTRLPGRPLGPNATGPLVPSQPGPVRTHRATGLQAEGLRVAYGAVLALDGVDLDLRAGQVHALIGPNGSGKSTLLRVLAGDLVPEAGEVRVDGRPVAPTNADRVRAGVARTPQTTVTLARQPPGRQTAVGARAGAPAGSVLRGLLATPASRVEADRRSAVVTRALQSCGLAAVADVDPARLAVGEQRLLQIARVVATGAGVLLLDEPAAGMTAQERTRLVEVLRGLARSGYAVLLVEHDVRLVTAVADTVTVLDAGRVLASGPPAEVRADPAVRRAYLGDLSG